MTTDPEMSSRIAGQKSMRFPVVEENMRVSKQKVKTGLVTVRSVMSTKDVTVEETLSNNTVRVERVPIDRILKQAPLPRIEGDRTIVPVIEEIFVRRLRLVEEVHLVSEQCVEPFKGSVSLRRLDVLVDRTDLTNRSET